jgi:hypothetical protein
VNKVVLTYITAVDGFLRKMTKFRSCSFTFLRFREGNNSMEAVVHSRCNVCITLHLKNYNAVKDPNSVTAGNTTVTVI